MIWGTLATAATDPIALLVHVAAGAPAPTLGTVARAAIPLVLSSFLAICLTRIVYDLTIAVKHARDLGSYHLVSPIGRGGMGEVWRAEHRMLARPAAVKLIRPDSDSRASKDLLIRFEREAQSTAALRSPHTVEVYDFGMTDDGAFYYVMELLTGLDADTLVRRHGPLPPERVVFLLRQVCQSLEEAHARELVHRDIKPANIYVCRYGLEGTPEYMAPEIARGERHFDHRADLYSLGCVAYWLLSGHPVFEGKAPIEIMIDHVRAEPLRPSVRSGVTVPSALEDIVMSCLEKDPARRPQSANELGRRMAALSFDPWTPEHAEKWWRSVTLVREPVADAKTWAFDPQRSRIIAPAG